MIAAIVISGCVCLLMITSIIFFPSIKIGKFELKLYPVIALVGAIILLLSNVISFSEVVDGLFSKGAINPIKILVLFISIAVLSIFLDEIEFFKYLALYALKKAGGKPKRLFFYLYTLVSILTVFTSNDIIILTFTPFIYYFAKNAKINPLPFLLAEFTAANTWSMALIIGNPTNIYLATASGITFLQYASVMIVPTIAGGLTSLLILYLLFKKQLSAPMPQPEIETVEIKDKFMLWMGIVHLALAIIFMVISSYINIDMWLIALIFAGSLMVFVLVYNLIKRQKPVEIGRTVLKLPWELIPFVIGMFVIVLSLEKHSVTSYIAYLLGTNGTTFTYGVSSFFASNLINNIPMSVLYNAIIKGLSGTAQIRAIYGAIVGSNLGAILTPIGALAGIMWLSILKQQKSEIGFKHFVKYGWIISLPTLAVTLGMLEVMCIALL